MAAAGAFDEIVRMIDAARERAWRAVNSELVSLYWEIGKWLSARRAKAEWGDKTLLELAAHLAKTRPDLKGFSLPGLYRRLQFYELYKDDEIVSPLVRQIGWTQHLIIMARAKTPEERRFYIASSCWNRTVPPGKEQKFSFCLRGGGTDGRMPPINMNHDRDRMAKMQSMLGIIVECTWVP